MKKSMTARRLGALMLALLTLASLLTFVSCGDNGTNEDNSATTTAAADKTGGDETTGVNFVKHDYEKAEFVVWQRSYDASTYKSLYIENFTEDTSDIMSQAVAKRNNMLEDYYNITLTVRNGFTTNDMSIALQGGALDVDIVLGQKNALAPVIITGQLQPFDDLDIDYTTDWWHDQAFTDLEVAGHHYLASNDVSIYRFCGARFFYWNKRIQKDRGLDSPYTLMKEGKWDLEHFLAMVKGVSTDNGFSALGEYGLLLETGAGNGVFAHLASGCGITLTTTQDDEIKVTLSDQMEKIDTMFSTLKSVFSDIYCCMDFSLAQALDYQQEGAGADGIYNYGRKLFAAGHFLFTHTNIACSSQFIEMEDEYGVAPNPKYNADQENYIHKDDCNSLIWAIPNSNTIDTTRLARVMDYWAYASHDTVMSDYYEITIKTKRAYEMEAGQVIDIVKETTVSEIAECLNIGLGTVLNDAYNKGSITSAWAEKKSEIEKKLEDYNEYDPY